MTFEPHCRSLDLGEHEVRCLECHGVYAQGRESHSGCPSCGSVRWLALSVPVAEDARARPSLVAA